MLDIHRLSLLRAVKLSGSMTAAARELSYSHSAISQQLALLEREAGTPLLEKVGRNVRLTPAGEELVRNTEAVLAAVERAESDLAAFHDQPRGEVRVAAFATACRSIMPAALAMLADRHPQISVRLHTADPEDALPRLTSRQADLVLTDVYPGTESVVTGGVHVTALGRDPVRGYLPKTQDGKQHLDADRVGTVSWVMEPPAAAATQWALRVCRELGFEPLVAYESADLLFHLRMVEAGLAAAFLPDMVLREFSSTVSPSPALPADQHRAIHLVVRQGSENRPALAAVRAAVVDAFAQLNP